MHWGDRGGGVHVVILLGTDNQETGRARFLLLVVETCHPCMCESAVHAAAAVRTMRDWVFAREYLPG